MKTKFTNESLNDYIKPKSKEDVEKAKKQLLDEIEKEIFKDYWEDILTMVQETIAYHDDIVYITPKELKKKFYELIEDIFSEYNDDWSIEYMEE